MNSTLLKIKEVRPDLSDYVFHFTKGKDAKQTLCQIVGSGKLLDITGRGIICFTEAPLLALVDMFEIFNRYSNPLYAPYGIAIRKDELFSNGGRPVIYSPESERSYFNKKTQWRFEPYETHKDFTWLREWRIQSNEYPFNSSSAFIITIETHELLEYTHTEGDISIDADPSDGGFDYSYYQDFVRNWRSISIEQLKSYKDQVELQQEIAGQCIDCIDFHGYLGSEWS